MIRVCGWTAKGPATGRDAIRKSSSMFFVPSKTQAKKDFGPVVVQKDHRTRVQGGCLCQSMPCRTCSMQPWEDLFYDVASN